MELTTHQTFLKHDGSGKAPIDKMRLFAAGGRTIGAGVWFGEADPDSEFIVAEGIEVAALRSADFRRSSRLRGPVGVSESHAGSAA